MPALPAGQRTGDYIGAAALLSTLPQAGALLADRGYDADWFRNALIAHDTTLYKNRHKIENTFARLKDWRRIATRYDRCADIFMSACALAAVVMFWL